MGWFMQADLQGALSGIRVCDFSWVGAGPIATNVLAQCGAEVIKIESAKRPDILRKGGPFKDGISTGLERSGYFANRNPNKSSIALNMSHPKAIDVAVRLIKQSDIVINNFRVGQMEKWGLGWDEVKALNPKAIYVTMSLQGVTGPHKSYMGFGVNLNALCGLTAQAANPGETPFGTGTNYTDHVMVPAHTLFGILAALLQREITGAGQTLAVSQLESAIAMKPMDAMAWAANREILGPAGCSDRRVAPHGVYNCAKENTWIAIAVTDESQWQALKQIMGNPAWSESNSFADLPGRLAHREQLDRQLESWTEGFEVEALARKLQAAGICAGPVNNAREAIENPHLRERQFWAYLDHPEVGETLYNRAPMVFSETPLKMERAAPLLGQHTQQVLTELLGYSDEEVAELSRQEVLV